MHWGRIFHLSVVFVLLAGPGCSLIVPGSRRTADFDAGAGSVDAPNVGDAPFDGARDVPMGLDVPMADAPMLDAPMLDAPMLDAPVPDAPDLDGGSDAGSDAGRDGGRDAPCPSVMGFIDSDGDSWGEGTTARLLCTDAGLPIVMRGGDCNDADDTVYPDAVENECDGVNTDCDLVLDADEAGADAACAWGDCLATGCAVPTDIEGGWEHVCARIENGELWCWGSDAAGQRDVDGSAADAFSPELTDHTGVIDHCAMDTAHCAIDAAGLDCWGTASMFTLPFHAARTDLVEVACGERHVCVRTSAGAVLCAGLNTSGQAGVDPATTGSVATLTTVLASGATAIDAGTNTSCAVDGLGQVQCWGGDGGLLGRGTTSVTLDWRPEPVVWTGDAFVEVTVMHYATCARTMAGAVACWGASFNSLTIEHTAATILATPTEVAWTSRALGTSRALHHCGIEPDGTLACWGTNNTHAFGASPRTAVRATAIPEPSFPRAGPASLSAIDVTAGSRAAVGYTCAIESAGARRIFCWGANGDGQAGAPMGTDPVIDAVEVRP